MGIRLIRFFFILLALQFPAKVWSQCAGTITIVSNPGPSSGGYAPGTVVNYCVTMNGYNTLGTNWFEGFDINLGPGWLPGSITPVSPPANCGGAASGGSWIWLNTSTSTAPPIQSFGPGYFFDLNNNGIAGDDWGDGGNCTWTFCFNVTVGNNIGSALTMTVAPLSDGVAGSWGSNTCDAVVYSTGTPSSTVVNGCTMTASATVTSNVTCLGGSDGAAQINQANGTGPYTYSLGGGPPQASNSFSGLAAGNYSVVVTAANGCTATANFTITQPATGITASVSNQVNASCNGSSDAEFTISASNGVAPYSYALNGGASVTTTTFSNLNAGNYTVTIQDASGCTMNQAVVITEPAVLNVNVASQTDVLCFGQSTGSVTLSGSGGTAPYSFSFASGAFSANNIFSNLSAGTYTIGIMDANACMGTANVTVNQPAQALSISLVSQTDVDCFGAATGAFSLTAAGGTSPYNYSINGSAFSAASVFNNLSSGAYTVVVQDANACTASISVNISEPAAALSLTSATLTPVDCFGASTGAVDVLISGGTPAYNFSLNASSNSSGSFTGLSAGPYNVIATDANGCTLNIPIIVTQPASALTASIASQNNVLCSGTNTGEFQIQGAGGTGAYSFSNGGAPNTTGVFQNLAAGVYNPVITDANGCTATIAVNLSSPNALGASIISQQDVNCFGGNDGSLQVGGTSGVGPYSYSLNGGTNLTGSYSGLTAGTYSVIVTDQNGCTFTQTVTIAQPAAALQGNIVTINSVSCNGLSDGSFVVGASGGTAPYTYTLAATTNASGSFSSLPFGPFSVTVTDANGCTAGITVNVPEPALLTLAVVNQTAVDCFGNATGAFSIAAAGGTPGFTYNNGSSQNTSGSFTALLAGVYACTVIDANGCNASLNVTVSQPLAPLSLSVQSQIDVLCFGASTGQVTLNAAGGTPVFNYALSGGGGTNNPVIGTLVAGTYSFVVTDANGCTAQTSTTITQPAQGLTLGLISSTDILCFGANTGEINVNASNGVAPYQYNIAATNNLTGQFTGLTSGSYSVLATDANGCTASLNVSLSQPAQALQLSLVSLVQPTCHGFSDGLVTVNVSGGTPVYQFQWLGFPTVNAASLTGIPEGNYDLTVTDNNGCTVQQSFTLDDPDFQISFTGPASVCEGDLATFISSQLEGAAPVSFVWNISPYNQSVSGSQLDYLAQSQSVAIELTATDANGCMAPPFTLNLNVNPLPIIDFSVSDTKGCAPFCPLFTASSDIANSTFDWNFGNGTSGSVNQTTGCYSAAGIFDVALRVTSPQGCFRILDRPDYMSVSPKPLAEFAVTPRFTTISNPLISTINKSSKDNKMIWDFGDDSGIIKDEFEPVHTYKNPGDYCILLITENEFACVDSGKVCVVIRPDLRIFVPNAFTPNGDGLNDFFEPLGDAYTQIEMKIFSRWGNEIFHIKGEEGIIWSGEGQPDGVYLYDILVWDREFKTTRLQGDVTLIR
jgi:gliding motility-associated-like protein